MLGCVDGDMAMASIRLRLSSTVKKIRGRGWRERAGGAGGDELNLAVRFFPPMLMVDEDGVDEDGDSPAHLMQPV